MSGTNSNPKIEVFPQPGWVVASPGYAYRCSEHPRVDFWSERRDHAQQAADMHRVYFHAPGRDN